MQTMQFHEPSKSPKIRHLDAAQIINLIEQYYAGRKIKDLLQEFQLDVQPGQLISLLPPLINNDITCEYCQCSMLMFWQGRSSNLAKLTKPSCISCRHVYDETACCCAGCQGVKEQARLALNASRKQILFAQYQTLKAQDDAKTCLSLREKVYLSALVRTGLAEGSPAIQPLCEMPHRLSPVNSYTEQILNYLYAERLIIYSPESALSAFEFAESTVQAFEVMAVTWELNLEPQTLQEQSNLLESLLYPKRITLAELEEAVEIWQEIAMYECLGHLANLLKKFRLPAYRVGKRTKKSFQYIFASSTTAQVYYFIWKAVQNVIAYQRATGVPDYIAIKTIPAYLVEFSDRFHSNKWSIEKRARAQHEMTAISKVFYYAYLKIGDLGFDVPLTSTTLLEIWSAD